MDLIHNALWQVSLSSGETFYEEKGDYISVPGQLSPWQRLQKYIVETKTEITSLSLYTNDGRTFNLPSSGKNPKFRPFSVSKKPIDYNMCRYLGQDIRITGSKQETIGSSDHFTVIEAIYPDYKLQVWVDEKNTRNSWTLVVPNEK